MFADFEDILVAAPGFDDPDDTVSLHVSASWVQQNAMHYRSQRLLDFWALVKGKPPPINCIGHHEGYVFPELSGVQGSNALFCGLERPINGSDDGDEVYVFISNPPEFYRYLAHMVCVARLREAPKNAVFACYVRRYQQKTEDGFSGRVLAWEWVKADAEQPNLPQDWQERYQAEKWRR